LFSGAGCYGNYIPDNDRTKRAQNCYVDLGCFSNDPPFNNTEGALPLDRNFIHTTFWLIPRDRFHPDPIKLVLHDRQRLNASGFDPSLPTKFIIHGFLQHGRVRWIINMAMEFLRKVFYLFFSFLLFGVYLADYNGHFIKVILFI